MLSAAEKAKLMRKIDLNVLPMLFLIFVASFLDRSNISNALTMGLSQELGLAGPQLNITLAIFFVPYIVFEIPSNILMRRFTPHVWLSLCIFGFGIVELAQGFVHSYSGLLAARFFLGFFESGISPGSYYLTSFWYRRQQSLKRFTIIWCSVLIASAFGGLLASAIAQMDGIRGLSNWRWIFILEGIFTILVSVAAFFFVSDFPRGAKWLSPREKQFVLTEICEDTVPDKTVVTRRDLIDFMKDAKNYFGALMYFSCTVPLYGFGYFTPTIVKSLGYSTVQTQLHSVPPFAAALGLCLILAYLSDLTNIRLPYVLFCSVLVIVGLAILMSIHTNFAAQYAAICLVCMGAYTAGPIVICWFLMNLEGHKRRSIGSGWIIGFGNTGGIVAPFAFLAQDAPYYHPGYTMCMAIAALGIAVTLCYSFLILRERRQEKVAGSTNSQRGLGL
ncbi:putative allantoate permease [Hypomontagnella monticulosa]|nr:putative allantoate permease [Hypomontagnella monticulosa]